MRKTKIICTLGPASDTEEVIKELILAGMDVARINFSHGEYSEHKHKADTVKKLRAELGVHTAATPERIREFTISTPRSLSTTSSARRIRYPSALLTKTSILTSMCLSDAPVFIHIRSQTRYSSTQTSAETWSASIQETRSTVSSRRNS